MSEKSKGDTLRIVKNSLLSACVTGLTFEDFPNKPLLLPAAPPVATAASQVSWEQSREPQKVVTVGQKPNIDTETLSEISLNTPVEDDGDCIDINDNLKESKRADGSILYQAASSFSQLPTVASTVLSTFSRVIKDYSPTNNTRGDNSEENNRNRSNIIPDGLTSKHSATEPLAQRDFGPQLHRSDIETPKLYTPSDITFPPLSKSQTPTSGSQNNYRISSKKKVYAQIPGLLTHVPTKQDEFVNLDRSNISEPTLIQGIEVCASTSNQSNFKFPTQQDKQEQQSGIFFLSNLVPPIWQNLSGLVQDDIKLEPKESQCNKELNSNHFGGKFFNNQEVTADSLENKSIELSELHLLINANISSSSELSNKRNSKPEEFCESVYLKDKIGLPTGLIESNTAIKIIKEYQRPPKPPIGNNITNNFRLKKGTRHYKAALPSFSVSATVAPLSALNENYSSSTLQLENNQDLFSTVTVFDPTKTDFNESVKQNPIAPPREELSDCILKVVQSPYLHQQEKCRNEGVVFNVNQNPIFTTFHTSVDPITERQIEQEGEQSSKNITSELNRSRKPDIEDNFSKLSQIETLHIESPTEPSFIYFENISQESVKEEHVEGTTNAYDFQSTQSKLRNIDNKSSEKDTFSKISNFDVFFCKGSQNLIQSSIISSLHSSTSGVGLHNVIQKQKQGHFTQKEENCKYPPSSLRLDLSTNISKNYLSQRNQSENQLKIYISHEQALNLYDDIIETKAETNNFDVEEIKQDQEKIQFFDIVPKREQDIFTHSQFPPSTDINVISSSNFNKEKLKIQENLVTNKQKQSVSDNNIIDPLTFFESFHHPTTIEGGKEGKYENNSAIDDSTNLRIQDFFNYPLQNISDSCNNLNYKLVGNGVSNNRLENLSALPIDSSNLSPVSNIVEPPSSTCSEFSKEITSQIFENLKTLTTDDSLDELLEEFKMAGVLKGNCNAQENTIYTPPTWHWFYKRIADATQIWIPFSSIDSNLLEDKFLSEDDCKVVAVEAGRYDVNIPERIRKPLYWSGLSSEVRRCSWFYKTADSKFVPYEEATANLLEEEYKEACINGDWHRKIDLPTGETIVFHGPTVMVHFLQSSPSTDAWIGPSQNTKRPHLIKRGLDDFNIEAGESSKPDHLLLMVHGIGSACDLKFRPVEEVVDEFRSIASQLIQSHYKNSCEQSLVNRIEVLPVSWHSQLHSEESGIDEKLKAITLESIPKLRNFANDTLLDVLFYTSPIFCQNIINTVASAMNRIYAKYCQRNPDFKGGVSLAGHSLGSLILFDLLCHQKFARDGGTNNTENPDNIEPLKLSTYNVTVSQQVSYTVGSAGTGQPFINYPQLIFHPKMFFALGSPIGMFVTIRGIDALGLEFKLPTCPGFFNIFHPFDPVAYRIEALVNPDLCNVRPVLIPHHKGRKRMHLELKETIVKVGADLKQKLVNTFKNTLSRVYYLAPKNKTDVREIEAEVDKVLEMQLNLDKPTRSRTSSNSTQSDVDCDETDLPLGELNNSRRIDYVLQEAPLEFFNEYLFALTSHVCYWESEDTILFIVKQIYSSLGIGTDSQIPQQSMTIERPNSSDS